MDKYICVAISDIDILSVPLEKIYSKTSNHEFVWMLDVWHYVIHIYLVTTRTRTYMITYNCDHGRVFVASISKLNILRKMSCVKIKVIHAGIWMYMIGMYTFISIYFIDQENKLPIGLWSYRLHFACPLRWRQNGRDSVSNHQPHDCLLKKHII